jgi:hypothetical protein
MIRQLRFTIIALAAVALHAQSATWFQVHIPFAFVAAGQSLNAGDYTIAADTIPGLLVLTAARGKESVVVKGLPIAPAATPDRSRLVFNRYGDRYFLSEVWPPGSASGRQVPSCDQERGLSHQASPEHTTIAAR